jgi:hypothetical protein
MSERERRRWEEKITKIIEANREFLIYIASEKRA